MATNAALPRRRRGGNVLTCTYLIAGDGDTEGGQEEGEAEELCPLVAAILLLVNGGGRRQRYECL